MRDRTVPWRRVFVGVMAVVAAAAAVIVVARAAGFDAVDATVPRSSRWFADPATGRVVLVDGYSGRALARLEPGGDNRVDQVVESGGQVAVLDRVNATTRSIDGALLRLGPIRELPSLSVPSTVVGMGQSGLVAVEPSESRAFVVPPTGAPVNIDVVASDRPDTVQIAPDGAVWSLVSGTLRRTTSSGAEEIATGLGRARYSLVGNRALIVQLDTMQARFGDGAWVRLPDDLTVDELVVQEASPDAECGWLGVNARLLCIGPKGLVHDVTVTGLDIDGGDLLAIAGEAGVVVDRSAGVFEQIDWRNGEVVDEVRADVGVGTELRVSTSVDLIWVDAVGVGTVWAVNPWGIHAVRKDDASTPLIGESGGIVESSSGGVGDGLTVGDDDQVGADDRLDDNGIDDPPVAVDDTVSARAGSSVPIAVTANDYDPDGDAIMVIDSTTPSYGTTELTSATTLTYQPQPGYAGSDSFDYTIVDINGNEATATVRVNLIPSDAPNQPPTGAPDLAQTGPERAVSIDVLLNDVDPERDPMRIESFTTDPNAGTVQEVTAPSGLPGLRFEPAAGFFGRATFDYLPMDTLGAVGQPVSVVVDVAAPGDENLPPIARPDSIRVKRGTPTELRILDNDVDPDGDELSVELVSPIPDSIEAEIRDSRLAITARAGAEPINALWYRLSDGRGGEAIGSVAVGVADDTEPNRPPIANADSANAVALSSTTVDVLANDSDPDGDPLVLLSAATAGDGSVQISNDRVVFTAPALVDDEVSLEKFTYVITDGQGHESEGTVSVRVLAERLPDPPVALPDSVTTPRDTPVAIDVLRNDSDPSGDRLSVVAAPGCPSGGTATLTGDGGVQFVPPSGTSGVFRCNYEIANSAGRTASSTITITVVAPTLANRPPLVSSEEITVDANGEVSVNVLANDTDPDGDDAELKLISVTTPVTGSVDFAANGIVTYEAPARAGAVSLAYDVRDPGGAVASGRLVIRIVGGSLPDEVIEPEPPTALDDFRTVTAPVQQVRIDVVQNDSDPDGSADQLVVTAASVSAGSATAEFTPRELVISPAPEFVGDIRVDYTITDADGLKANAVATLTVLEIPNRPPVANDDGGSVPIGLSVVIPIAANDSDPDGDRLTYSLVSSDRSFGSASIRDGRMTFTSNGRADGVTSVVYMVTDGEFVTEATVRIEVIGCNAAPPQVRNGFIETGYRQPIQIDLSEWVLNGTVVDVRGAINSPSAVYTPPDGFNGNATVTFVAENACGQRVTGELTIDVNQDPVASGVEVSLGRFDSRTIYVNTIATDDEPLTINTLLDAPQWATVTDNGSSISLSPSGASGRVNFEAVVRDPGGLSVRVPITVSMRNEAPTAVDDSFEATAQQFQFDPLANDLDVEGDALSYRVLPSEITFSNDSSIPIERGPGSTLIVDLTTARGEGTFRYDIVDRLGSVSDSASVTLTVIPSPPVIEPVFVEVTRGQSTTSLISNADLDRDPATYSVDPAALPQGVTLVFDGNRLTATASDDAVTGEYLVPYTAVDSTGLSASSNLLIRVFRTEPANITQQTSTDTTTTTRE